MIATAILGRELFGLHVGPSGLAFDGRDVSACRDSHEYPAADTRPQAKKEEYRLAISIFRPREKRVLLTTNPLARTLQVTQLERKVSA